MMTIEPTDNLMKWARTLRDAVNLELQIDYGAEKDDMMELVDPPQFAAGRSAYATDEPNRIWVKMENRGYPQWFAEGGHDVQGPSSAICAERLEHEE